MKKSCVKDLTWMLSNYKDATKLYKDDELFRALFDIINHPGYYKSYANVLEPKIYMLIREERNRLLVLNKNDKVLIKINVALELYSLLVIIGALKEYDAKRGVYTTYVAMILRNKFIDGARKMKSTTKCMITEGDTEVDYLKDTVGFNRRPSENLKPNKFYIEKLQTKDIDIEETIDNKSNNFKKLIALLNDFYDDGFDKYNIDKDKLFMSIINTKSLREATRNVCDDNAVAEKVRKKLENSRTKLNKFLKANGIWNPSLK